MEAILSDLDVTLLPRPESVPEIDETEDTLEGNALLKVREIVRATGHAALADDTGLFVDFLGGRPGVKSARYAGPSARDDENVKKLLAELEGVPAAQRTARFRTVICAGYPTGESFWVEGILEGTIGLEARGDQGFGYDPVFVPLVDGRRTLAEMTPKQKNDISHRARALRALAEVLQER